MNELKLSKCKNKKCKKKKNCFRFNDAKGEIILFKNLCSENNNYEWLIKISPNIILQK